MADGQQGGVRAVVNKIATSRCSNYTANLVGDGAMAATSTYTIPTDLVTPPPGVTLNTYWEFAEDGGEVTLAAERVQAVYHDGGGMVLDPAAGRFVRTFVFYVLVSLDVVNSLGAYVNCFAWVGDPATAGNIPPFDANSGLQGFAFNGAWTAVGP